MLFFVAGFESVSTVTSFALYELAIHPDIQERLAKEIKDEHVRNHGKLDFSSIQKMTYLDMVASGKKLLNKNYKVCYYKKVNQYTM